jgi:hypothetical protein
MRLLYLANGEFQVFSMPHGKYDIVYKTRRGSYKQLQAENEEVLKRCIRLWTDAKYIHKLVK